MPFSHSPQVPFSPSFTLFSETLPFALVLIVLRLNLLNIHPIIFFFKPIFSVHMYCTCKIHFQWKELGGFSIVNVFKKNIILINYLNIYWILISYDGFNLDLKINQFSSRTYLVCTDCNIEL